MDKLKIVILTGLILIVTFVTFLPALKNGFNYDDDLYIINNSLIESFSPYNLKKIFTSSFYGNYHPVTILSFLFEYPIFKLNPLGYHITNLILHLFNCLLVFWLFYLLGGNIPVALLTSVFFAIHPLRAESVAWVSGRKDLLYALFFLGALISYVYYLNEKKGAKFYYLTLFLFVLSLLSKPMAVTLPIVLFLLEYFIDGKQNKINLLDKAPFVVLSLIFAAVTVFSQSATGAIRQENLSNISEKLTNITYAVVFYLNKLFIPDKLVCLYPFPEGAAKSASGVLFVLLLLLAAVFIRKTHSKIFIFGSVFFLITIMPVIQIVPFGDTLVSDRYSYVPLIGICYLAAYGFFVLYNRIIRCVRLIQISLVILLMSIVSALSFLTWAQCEIWKDGMTLWSNVLTNYPDVAAAYNNRGVLLHQQKKYSKAYSDFKRAIYYKPKFIAAYLNLGSLYNDMGKSKEAIAEFEEILKIDPENAEAYFNLGNIYNMLDRRTEAISLYNKAVKFNKNHVLSYYYLSMLYEKINNKEAAVKMLNRAIEIDPNYLSSYVALARLYESLGRNEEELNLYKKAIRNNLDYFSAYYNIGNLFNETGKDKEAIILYKKAIKIDPASAQAYIGLGTSYSAIGRNKEAIRALEEAIRLNPGLSTAHNNLAVAYYYEKNYDLAVKHCDKAIELGYNVMPDLLALLRPYRKVNK